MMAHSQYAARRYKVLLLVDLSHCGPITDGVTSGIYYVVGYPRSNKIIKEGDRFA